MNIHSVNPWYLIVDKVDGFIEEKEGNKYLNPAFTDNNSEILKKYAELWDGIKSHIKKWIIHQVNMKKEYMNIKFNSGDGLPLDKPLKFHMLTIIVRSIFLDDCLYEL